MEAAGAAVGAAVAPIAQVHTKQVQDQNMLNALVTCVLIAASKKARKKATAGNAAPEHRCIFMAMRC
jgi:hypothetical protein